MSSIEEKVVVQTDRQVSSVELLNNSNLTEAISFLMANENFSLFLLGNLEAHGPKLTSSPNSGNFKFIRFEGKVVTVFSLTRRGNLLVQSSLDSDWIFGKILDSCREEHLPILGLLGEWSFCQKFWSLLKQQGIIQKDRFASKEILYTLDLKQQTPFNSPNVRLLTPKDYDQWESLRIQYFTEYLNGASLPYDFSLKELHEEYLEKVHKQISCGYFLGDRLLAIADLNAKAKDLGQVGGVYTTSASRRQGFAQAVMQGLMRDARDLHKICKLIIFTGETNASARKLYESLNVHPVGYYALMFGESQYSEETHAN